MNDTTSDILLDRSVLMSTLKDSGYFVKTGDIPNILTEDQAIFNKKFVKDLSTQDDYPENIEKMAETLSSWMEDETFLIKCLSPTDTSQSCSTARSSKQDSLLRLLLNVDELQPKLLKLLLEKLAEISIVDEGAEETQSHNIPRMILSSMRWLDTIIDGSGIAEKMSEILNMTSRYQQVEVIAALPEILPSSQHNTIALTLHNLLEDTQPLVSSIVDCLGNLNLSQDLVDKTRKVIVKSMAASRFQLSDLPTVVDYLLTSINKKGDSCSELVSDLRDHLELTVKMRASQRPGPSSVKSRENDNKKSIECIVLDKLNISMLTEKKLLDAWIAALEATNDPEEMKTLDVLVLIMMYKNKQKRKRIETLLKSKIKHGTFTEELIASTFEKHTSALKVWMTSLLDVAEVLLLSPDKTVSEGAGVFLFVLSFINLGELCQREIVSQLVTAVSRCDSALLVLKQLSLEHSDHLARYGWYLVGLLNHVHEGMELAKIRSIIGVLSRLAWRKGSSTSGQQIQDDVVIFVKKQIQSGILNFKQLGVVSGVVCARAMLDAASGQEEEAPGAPLAESSRTSSGNNTSEISVVLSGLSQEAWELLEFVNNKTANYPELAGMFLDEMCISLINTSISDKAFLEKFQGKFASRVEEDYIEDIVEYENENYGIKMTCEMLLDKDVEDSDKPISLFLAPMVSISHGLDSTSSSLIKNKNLSQLARLLPLLRLLHKTVSLSSGGVLDDVDALLGCGIWTFSSQVLENIDNMQQDKKIVVLTTIFYCINWFIELINGFCVQNDEDSKKKVLMRVKQIVEMRKHLETALKSCPTFRPPTVLFGDDTSSWVPPSVALAKKVPKSGEKGKKGGKGKKSKVPSETMMNATMNMNTQKTSQNATTQAPKSQRVSDEPTSSIIDLNSYQPFFREMDLNCIRILEVEPVTTQSSPSMSQESEDPKLRPPELLFLLNDLHAKLDKVLSNKKRGFPGKQNFNHVGFTNVSLLNQKDVIIKVSETFKFLFSHLDELNAYFKRLEEVNDESVELITTLKDSDSLINLDAVKAGLKIVLIFFSWSGFKATINDDILRQSLLNVASRVTTGLSHSSSLSEIASHVVKYLKSFSASALTVDIAATHVTLMSCICNLGNNKDLGIISKVAESYLQKEWLNVTGEREKGSQYNSEIERLLQHFVANSKNIFATLHTLAMEGTHLVMDKDVGESEKFPFISKNILGVVYKVVFASLVEQVKTLKFGTTKDRDELFEKWEMAVAVFVKLVMDTKSYCTMNLLAVILKHSRFFVDHFTREGMVLLEKNFKHKKEGSSKLIASLQKGTRHLQNVCGHAKLEKYVALAAKVPYLKKSLEIFIYRAKAMLAANNCLEAFDLGILKNKDLKGQEIITQQDDLEEVEEEEEDEEEGEHDDDDREEELVLNENDISEEI